MCLFTAMNLRETWMLTGSCCWHQNLICHPICWFMCRRLSGSPHPVVTQKAVSRLNSDEYVENNESFDRTAQDAACFFGFCSKINCCCLTDSRYVCFTFFRDFILRSVCLRVILFQCVLLFSLALKDSSLNSCRF